jgi:hypothetical protein
MISRVALLLALSCCACEQHHPLASPAMPDGTRDAIVDAGGNPPAVDATQIDLPMAAGAPAPNPSTAASDTAGCSLDQDRDGYRVASAVDPSMLEPGCARTEPGDCDDTTAKIDPESPERCDGLDDDCDGRIDEGRTCAVMFQALLNTNSDLSVASDAAGVIYRYRADTSSVERLAADESVVWTAVVPAGWESQGQLAVDGSRGAVYFAMLGGDPPKSDLRTLIVRFDAETGRMVWQRMLDVGAEPTSIAIDHTGDVHVSGLAANNLGDETTRAGLLLQLRASDGEIVRIDSPEHIEVEGVATGADGALAVVAQFDSIDATPVSFGPCQVAPVDLLDPFVMYVAADGSCGWVKYGRAKGGSSSLDDFTQVAFLADGAIVIAGAPFSNSTLADVSLVDPMSRSDFVTGIHKIAGDEVLVMVLERSGEQRWFRRVPNLGWGDRVRALRVDGTQLLLGLELNFYEVYNFGYSNSTDHALAVLMAFDANTGADLWNRDLELPPPREADRITSIARAADGSLRLAFDGAYVSVQPASP